MASQRTADEWAAEYGAKRSTYKEFSRRLVALISDLLASEPIDVIQVESRAKTVESFAEKLPGEGMRLCGPVRVDERYGRRSDYHILSG